MDKKKILVVDDERNLLLILEKVLTAEGYSVITVNNGADAVISAKLKNPDLIILDVSMPGMDGSEVAEKLKDDSKTENIPIIFLTGLFSKEQEKKGGSMVGGNVFLAKPYDTEKLLTTVKTFL